MESKIEFLVLLFNRKTIRLKWGIVEIKALDWAWEYWIIRQWEKMGRNWTFEE